MTDKLLIAEHLVVVALLDELHLLPVEGIQFETVNVSSAVVQPDLLYYNNSVTEANAEVVPMSITAFVFVADEHPLAVIPCRDMHARAAVCWQNAVEQVLVDCFG